MAAKKKKTQASKTKKRSKSKRSASRHEPLVTTRLLNGFLTGRFPFLEKQLLQVDANVQKQIIAFRKVADVKAVQLRGQMEQLLVELAQRLRKNLQEDLKRVEVALRDLATRISKLERNIKKI